MPDHVWYYDAVEQGIITGKGNGILDPKGQATPAQVAAMLCGF
ncbi:S-layer homology domain-containing protein [Zongyangia hominis]|nr:S-layer homology domain-containing protein [Zongyangia hominis]